MALNRIAKIVRTTRPNAWSFWWHGNPLRPLTGALITIASFSAEGFGGYETLEPLILDQARSQWNTHFAVLMTAIDREGTPSVPVAGTTYSIQIMDGAGTVLLTGTFVAGARTRTWQSGRVIEYAIDVVAPPAGIGFSRGAGAPVNASLIGHEVIVWRGVATETTEDIWCELRGSDALRLFLQSGARAFVSPYTIIRIRNRPDVVRGTIIEFGGTSFVVKLINYSGGGFVDLAMQDPEQPVAA